MIAALALAGLSAGGALLQGLGQKQASAKQARLQAIEDARVRVENEATLGRINTQRLQLGRELMDAEEHRWETNESLGYVDVDGMMAAAERYGMNPYSFAAAGGLAAYSNRTTNNYTRLKGHNAADAFKLMAPEYTIAQASQVPQQHSAMSAFGSALSAGANAFGTQYRADQSYDLQAQKLQLAVDQMGIGLSSQNGLRTAIAYGGTGGGVAGSSNARSGANAAAGMSDLPYPTKWKYQDDVTVTNPWSRSVIVGNLPDAEVGAKRYGEIAEEIFGLRNGINDFAYNVTGKTLEDWGRSTGYNVGDYVQKGDIGWGPAFSRWWNDPKLFAHRMKAQ